MYFQRFHSLSCYNEVRGHENLHFNRVVFLLLSHLFVLFHDLHQDSQTECRTNRTAWFKRQETHFSRRLPTREPQHTQCFRACPAVEQLSLFSNEGEKTCSNNGSCSCHIHLLLGTFGIHSLNRTASNICLFYNNMDGNCGFC